MFKHGCNTSYWKETDDVLFLLCVHIHDECGEKQNYNLKRIIWQLAVPDFHHSVLII